MNPKTLRTSHLHRRADRYQRIIERTSERLDTEFASNPRLQCSLLDWPKESVRELSRLNVLRFRARNRLYPLWRELERRRCA